MKLFAWSEVYALRALNAVGNMGEGDFSSLYPLLLRVVCVLSVCHLLCPASSLCYLLYVQQILCSYLSSPATLLRDCLVNFVVYNIGSMGYGGNDSSRCLGSYLRSKSQEAWEVYYLGLYKQVFSRYDCMLTTCYVYLVWNWSLDIYPSF